MSRSVCFLGPYEDSRRADHYAQYPAGRLRGKSQGAGGLEPKESQYLLPQSIGAPPGGIWTGNDPDGFEKVRTEQQNRPGSYLAAKAKDIYLCAYTEAGGAQVAFRVTEAAHRRERGGPKGVRLVLPHELISIGSWIARGAGLTYRNLH